MAEYYTIRWEDGVVRMIDQRLLPHQEVYREYLDYRAVAHAITDMVIRGAPAIGAAAGYGLGLAARQSHAQSEEQLIGELDLAATVLLASRPTAVNLRWAINYILTKVNQNHGCGVEVLRSIVINAAIELAENDVQTNRRMAQIGAQLIPDQARIIHHCNTGSLATVGYGTALGVIRYAHENGKQVHVYVDETRPRLQGARLTAWELSKLGIPHTVIVDGASGHIMRTQQVDLCLVGCDRIAGNGDVANKIGTYNLAMAAHLHEVPFFCVGPTSTIDMNTLSGDGIDIEERPEYEITHIGDHQITPAGTRVENPAFDVTPARFITAIVTEMGIAKPPYTKTLKTLIGEAERL